MSKQPQEIFMQLPGYAGEKVLHAGELLAVAADRYHGHFGGEVELAPEMDLLLCQERNSRFVKEPVRIVAVDRVGTRVLVELEIVGSSIPAESRASQRLETERENLLSSFGGEDGCRVLDVSSSGFAVAALREHRIGELIEAALYHEGQALPGTVSIRNMRGLGDGRVRYGVYCLDGVAEQRRLRHALPRLYLTLQHRR